MPYSYEESLPERFTHLLRQRPTVTALCLGVILLGCGAICVKATVLGVAGGILGSFFVVIGAQTILWAVGIRIELFGTATAEPQGEPSEDVQRLQRLMAEKEQLTVQLDIAQLTKQIDEVESARAELMLDRRKKEIEREVKQLIERQIEQLQAEKWQCRDMSDSEARERMVVMYDQWISELDKKLMGSVFL